MKTFSIICLIPIAWLLDGWPPTLVASTTVPTSIDNLCCFAARKGIHSSSSSSSKDHRDCASGSRRSRGSSNADARGNKNPNHKAGPSIPSLIGRHDDKISILRTVESLDEKDIDGAAAAAAWDRISQRSVSNGPRARHLPLLHTDRAFDLLLKRTEQLLPTLSPGHCSSIVTSLAKLRYRPEDDFLREMLNTCRTQSDTQTFSQAARLVSGLAKLDYQMEGEELSRLADLMNERIMHTPDDGPIHTESVALGLWSLAVTGALQDREDLMKRLMIAATSRLRLAHEQALVDGGRSDRKTKGLVRICRYLKTALLFTPLASNGAKASAEALEEGVKDVWAGLGDWLDPVQGSRLQREVESMLRTSGGIFAGEWEDGVMTVDIALHPREMAKGLRPVAIEVDGPSHFFVNHPRRPNGDTLIKHQALREGYPGQWAALISIPHFEWPKKNPKERMDLMKRKLKHAGLEPCDFLAMACDKKPTQQQLEEEEEEAEQ